MSKKYRGYIYCQECKYRGKPLVVRTFFDWILEIFLFIFLILPWIIYKIQHQPHYQCPKCGSRNVKYLPGGETQKCPFCGARVFGFDPTCPQCGRKLSVGEKYQKAGVTYQKPKKWKDPG